MNKLLNVFTLLLFGFSLLQAESIETKNPIKHNLNQLEMPSVNSSSTAIPCFFGKTEKAIEKRNNDLKGVFKKIKSLNEYEKLFGKSDKANTVMEIDSKGLVVGSLSEEYSNNMYYAVKHYFENGGGPCYIHSIGNYSESFGSNDYKSAINKLSSNDEITLLVLPDLSSLKNSNKQYEVYNHGLKKVAELGNKFVIIDAFQVLTNGKVDLSKSKSELRNNISSNINEVQFGAAYFPYLQTTYQFDYDQASIKMNFSKEILSRDKSIALLNGMDFKTTKDIFAVYEVIKYFNNISADITSQKQGDIEQRINSIFYVLSEREQELLKTNQIALFSSISKQSNSMKSEKSGIKDMAEMKKIIKLLEDKILALYKSNVSKISRTNQSNYSQLEQTFLSKVDPSFLLSLEPKLKKAFSDIPLHLPPSAAVAGVYVNVDKNRAVWKAPANVAVKSVVKPAVSIGESDLADFNIDPSTGKSINTIRYFDGKGSLVWGARTLAGNNENWKYVNVKRFVMTVENDCNQILQKHKEKLNDENTWVIVRAQIEAYLIDLWRKGGLQGTKASHAFYVKVGRESTMTPTDVTNGLLKVEIGLSAIRPQEFVVFRISEQFKKP